MAKKSDTNLLTLPLSEIHPRPGENPNELSPAQFDLLVNAVKKLGFLQPVTVRLRPDGAYELIDGHHRCRAAAQAGLKAVPALVTDATDEQALAEVLSLNRLKGEVDLGKASIMLRDLAAAGFDDLTLTGFNPAEVQALLADAEASIRALDDLGEGAGLGEEVDDPPVNARQRFAIRLVFDDEADRDIVRRALLQHGPTMEAGMLNLVEKLEN